MQQQQLPVYFHVWFKMLVVTFKKVWHGLGTEYFKVCLPTHKSAHLITSPPQRSPLVESTEFQLVATHEMAFPVLYNSVTSEWWQSDMFSVSILFITGWIFSRLISAGLCSFVISCYSRGYFLFGFLFSPLASGCFKGTILTLSLATTTWLVQLRPWVQS